MKVLKRLSLKNVSEYLSDKEMRNVVGGYDDGYGGSYDGDASHSMKCFNDTTSCWVSSCPGSRSDAEALCLTQNCGGKYGDFMSCA